LQPCTQHTHTHTNTQTHKHTSSHCRHTRCSPPLPASFLLKECKRDAHPGVYSFVFTKADVDQGKHARSAFHLDESFFCELKFSVALDDSRSSGSPTGKKPRATKPATEQEAWEDD
jgi:hypothetical protein